MFGGLVAPLFVQSSKIRQVVEPRARTRPSVSVRVPSAVPTRRPQRMTGDSAVAGPVCAVIGRTRACDSTFVLLATPLSAWTGQRAPCSCPATSQRDELRPQAQGAAELPTAAVTPQLNPQRALHASPKTPGCRRRRLMPARPSQYSSELARAICDAAATGESLTDICARPRSAGSRRREPVAGCPDRQGSNRWRANARRSTNLFNRQTA